MKHTTRKKKKKANLERREEEEKKIDQRTRDEVFSFYSIGHTYTISISIPPCDPIDIATSTP